MTTLFISDLHLSPSDPRLTENFLRFLNTAKQAETLYILGDFFDYWIGDDDTSEWIESIVTGLHALTEHGTKLYLMGGNRDFLMGANFAKRVGGTWLKDPTLISLYGTPILLIHGDSLCTKDPAYQYFRAVAQHPLTKKIYLALPLRARRAIARYLRGKSTASNQKKSYTIMDVSHTAVENIMRRYKVLRLIHGHTHVPKVVEFELDGKTATRTVLGAWDHKPSVLVYEPTGAHFETL